MTNIDLIDLVGQSIEHLLDRNQRYAKYSSITNFLDLRKGFNPAIVLDILKYMHPDLPSDFVDYLESTKGMTIDIIGGGIAGVTSSFWSGVLSSIYDLDWKINVYERLETVGGGSTAESAARIRTTLF